MQLINISRERKTGEFSRLPENWKLVPKTGNRNFQSKSRPSNCAHRTVIEFNLEYAFRFFVCIIRIYKITFLQSNIRHDNSTLHSTLPILSSR